MWSVGVKLFCKRLTTFEGTSSKCGKHIKYIILLVLMGILHVKPFFSFSKRRKRKRSTEVEEKMMEMPE